MCCWYNIKVLLFKQHACIYTSAPQDWIRRFYQSNIVLLHKDACRAYISPRSMLTVSLSLIGAISAKGTAFTKTELLLSSHKNFVDRKIPPRKVSPWLFPPWNIPPMKSMHGNNVVRLCAKYAVDANLFRLESSILPRVKRATNLNNVATEKRSEKKLNKFNFF